MKKFNKKYSSFNSEQTQLLEYKLLGNDSAVKSHVAKIKQKAHEALNEFYSTCDNKILLEKRETVKNRIDAVSIDANDRSIAQALMLSALVHEMEEGNE